MEGHSPLYGCSPHGLHRFALRSFAALAGAWILYAAPVAAQSQATAPSSATLLDPASITKIKDLDFGYVAGTISGSVVMTPTVGASCTATPGLVHSGVCQPAEFGGSGSFNQRLRVRKPSKDKIVLSGPGADMSVTNFSFDGNPDLRLISENDNFVRYRIESADGNFAFRVAGRLNVGTRQAPGVYSGTLTIELDYQ